MGIRVAVIDDNPHVRWRGQVYPVNATFHRFLSAFLDLDGSPVASIVHVVPLRELPDDAPKPQTLPLDPRLEVVGTVPFDGIAGYLRNGLSIVGANRPILRDALRGADLLWLKLPASNALLAAALARQAGVPRFGYVAGSARDVASARWTGIRGIGAQAIGLAWDAAGRIATLRAPRIIVGREIITSLVEPNEIRDQDARPWPWVAGGLRIAWAGRLVEGKGLERILEALRERPEDSLMVLGEGPEADSLRQLAKELLVADRVEWRGYVADRGSYLDALTSADVFVFPSPAEGFPKVVLDAMAVGLPVVASPAGTLAGLVSADLIEPVAPGDPAALRAMLEDLISRPARAAELRSAGTKFAAAHTRPAEVARLVRSWRTAYPGLRWG